MKLDFMTIQSQDLIYTLKVIEGAISFDEATILKHLFVKITLFTVLL